MTTLTNVTQTKFLGLVDSKSGRCAMHIKILGDNVLSTSIMEYRQVAPVFIFTDGKAKNFDMFNDVEFITQCIANLESRVLSLEASLTTVLTGLDVLQQRFDSTFS